MKKTTKNTSNEIVEADGTTHNAHHCADKAELTKKYIFEMYDDSTLDKVSSTLARDMLFHWISQIDIDIDQRSDPAAREKLVLMCRGALAVPGHHQVQAEFTTEMVNEVYRKLWEMWTFVQKEWEGEKHDKDAWTKYLEGHWTKERPTEVGVYDVATRDGDHAGAAVFYQLPGGELCQAPYSDDKDSWRGWFWSVRRPALPDPPEWGES
jgi:hypothetical protein